MPPRKVRPGTPGGHKIFRIFKNPNIAWLPLKIRLLILVRRSHFQGWAQSQGRNLLIGEAQKLHESYLFAVLKKLRCSHLYALPSHIFIKEIVRLL